MTTATATRPEAPIEDLRAGLIQTIWEHAGVLGADSTEWRTSASSMPYDDLVFAASAAMSGFVQFQNGRMTVSYSPKVDTE